MHDEAIYAERALRARANGYIMKQEATEKVLVAVRRILNGEVYLSERMSNKMLQQYIGGAPSMIQSQIASLSDRELGGLPLNRRRSRHPRNRRRASPQREDGRNLPGPHQGEARTAQRSRTYPARYPVEDQRESHIDRSPLGPTLCLRLPRRGNNDGVVRWCFASGNSRPLAKQKYERRIRPVPLAARSRPLFL